MKEATNPISIELTGLHILLVSLCIFVASCESRSSKFDNWDTVDRPMFLLSSSSRQLHVLDYSRESYLGTVGINAIWVNSALAVYHRSALVIGQDRVFRSRIVQIDVDEGIQRDIISIDDLAVVALESTGVGDVIYGLGEDPYGSAYIISIDMTYPRIINRLHIGSGVTPQFMAMDPSGRIGAAIMRVPSRPDADGLALFGKLLSGDMISIVDLMNGTIIDQITLDPFMSEMSFAADGKAIFLRSFVSRNVFRISLVGEIRVDRIWTTTPIAGVPEIINVIPLFEDRVAITQLTSLQTTSVKVFNGDNILILDTEILIPIWSWAYDGTQLVIREFVSEKSTEARFHAVNIIKGELVASRMITGVPISANDLAMFRIGP